MISMMYECPETHAPLPRISTAVWTAADSNDLVTIHCPHCSQRHTFSRADAILRIEGSPLMASEPDFTPSYTFREPAGVA